MARGEIWAGSQGRLVLSLTVQAETYVVYVPSDCSEYLTSNLRFSSGADIETPCGPISVGCIIYSPKSFHVCKVCMRMPSPVPLVLATVCFVPNKWKARACGRWRILTLIQDDTALCSVWR